MATGLAFRQLFCRAADCGLMFLVCRSCYRGQTYCSDLCRWKTRLDQVRRANRRYQQSPEGRQDHCDRQREYRQQRRCRVTDQSSPQRISWAKMAGAKPASQGLMAEKFNDLLHLTRQGGFRRLVCIFCGRRGRFIQIRGRRE
jgi:hypothetical protein